MMSFRNQKTLQIDISSSWAKLCGVFFVFHPSISFSLMPLGGLCSMDIWPIVATFYGVILIIQRGQLCSKMASNTVNVCSALHRITTYILCMNVVGLWQIEVGIFHCIKRGQKRRYLKNFPPRGKDGFYFFWSDLDAASIINSIISTVLPKW